MLRLELIDVCHQAALQALVPLNGPPPSSAWPEPPNVPALHTWVRKAIQLRAMRGVHTFVAFVQNIAVGATRLRLLMSPDSKSAELSYWISPGFRGHGYGFDAAAQSVAIAFDILHVDRVEAAVQIGNEPSLAIIRALGMQWTQEILVRPVEGKIERIWQFSLSRLCWERAGSTGGRNGHRSLLSLS